MFKTFITGTILILTLASNSYAEWMSVSFSGAEIRTAPTAAASKVVFTASRYYPLEVTSTEKEYYKVRDFQGRNGYIHKTLLKPVKSVLVSVGKANVRMGPGSDNDIAFQLEKGDSAKFLSKRDGWVEIQTADGDQGWIADFLVLGE